MSRDDFVTIFAVNGFTLALSNLLAKIGSCADMAQLVEHHLAKVRVAGSSPVVRSIAKRAPLLGALLEWRRGQVVRQRPAKPSSPVRIRSSPPSNAEAPGFPRALFCHSHHPAANCHVCHRTTFVTGAIPSARAPSPRCRPCPSCSNGRPRRGRQAPRTHRAGRCARTWDDTRSRAGTRPRRCRGRR
jgi:hypothetical protein